MPFCVVSSDALAACFSCTLVVTRHSFQQALFTFFVLWRRFTALSCPWLKQIFSHYYQIPSTFMYKRALGDESAAVWRRSFSQLLTLCSFIMSFTALVFGKHRNTQSGSPSLLRVSGCRRQENFNPQGALYASDSKLHIHKWAEYSGGERMFHKS